MLQLHLDCGKVCFMNALVFFLSFFQRENYELSCFKAKYTVVFT